MGQYFSASEFNGSLYREDYRGSGNYYPENWQPSLFTFDINPDTLELENVQLAIAGTETETNNPESERAYFIAHSDSDGEIAFKMQYFSHVTYGYGTNLAAGDVPNANNYYRFPDQSWLPGAQWNWETNPTYSGPYFIGFYLHPYLDTTIIFSKSKNNSLIQVFTVRSSNYISSEYVTQFNKFITDYFYGGASSQNFRLYLKSPTSRYFDVNQSSKIQFGLKNDSGLDYDVDATIAPYGIIPDNWEFDPSTNTLTLISSASPKACSFKGTYETTERTYSMVVTFLVRVNNPYTGGGISQPNGGAGSYENGTFGDPSTSDDITADLQDGSTFGNASSSGTFTRYLVNNSYLEIFGDWLWNTSLGLAIAQEVIRFIYGDPSESIISLMSYPFQLTGLEGVSHELRDFYWGNHNAGYQVPALLTTAGQFDWGTLTFDEYWGNFLDYSPYTRVQLYLPWGTGFVDVNPDEILPGTLSIKTVVEFDKGSCVHILSNQQGAVIGTYSGQCGKQVALMASDYSSKLARIAVMGAVAGGLAVGSAATGAMATASNIASGNFGFRTGARGLGFGGGMSAPMLNEGVMIENVSSAVHPPLKIPKGSLATKKHPINISRSGAFTDGSAGLGVQFPYVILSRPTQSVPEEYGAYEGYPSNIYANLSELKGYTEVGEIHLAGFENITVDEMNKLDELLKGGVIF